VSNFQDGCSRLQFEPDLAVEFTVPLAGGNGPSDEKTNERRSAYWTVFCDLRIVWANSCKT